MIGGGRVRAHPRLFRRVPATRRGVSRGGGTWHRAWVSGFLDDTTDFFVDVIAPSAERRDSLLAALGTLRRAAP